MVFEFRRRHTRSIHAYDVYNNNKIIIICGPQWSRAGHAQRTGTPMSPRRGHIIVAGRPGPEVFFRNRFPALAASDAHARQSICGHRAKSRIVILLSSWVAGPAVRPATAAAVLAPTGNCTCRPRNCVSTPVKCNGSTTTSCADTKIRVRDGYTANTLYGPRVRRRTCTIHEIVIEMFLFKKNIMFQHKVHGKRNKVFQNWWNSKCN